jgi:hypothetical protein
VCFRLPLGGGGDPGIQQHDRRDDGRIGKSAGQQRQAGGDSEQRDREAGELLGKDRCAGAWLGLT